MLDNGDEVVLPPTEPIKAGIAILFGQVQVTKAVTNAPPGIDLGTFPIDYRCTATPEGGQETEVAAGTLQVAANATVTVPGELPAGATCRFWETDSKGGVTDHGVSNPVEITVVPSITADGPQLVTIGNDFPPGQLLLSKQVVGDAVGQPWTDPDDPTTSGTLGSGPFTIGVDCQFSVGGTWSSLEGFPTVVELSDDETTTFTVPIGSRCLVAELASGNATTIVITRDGQVVEPGEPLPINVPDLRASTQSARVDVVVTNSFDTGSLRIRKEITGAGGPFADQDFAFEVRCSLPGMQLEPVTATIDRPAETEVVVDALPVGAACAVFEMDNGGASPPLPPEGLQVGNAVIAPDTEPVVEVTASNDFPAGQLTLQKLVGGPGAVDQTATDFTVQLTCQRPQPGDTWETILDEPVTIRGGQLVTPDQLLPVGSRCWAAETDDGGATSVVISATEADPVFVDDAANPNISITVTNVFDVGGLRITKTVQGPGAGFADQPFTFAVTCTLDGDAVPARTVTITPPATTATATGLPTGAVCTIAEQPPYGGADGAGAVTPGTVTIGPADSIVDVAAVNTFSQGQLLLQKKATGSGLTMLPADPAVGMSVTCTRATINGNLTIVDARPVRVPVNGAPVALGVDLPIGAACWAIETSTLGATTTSVDFGGPDRPATITVDHPTITITATDTYETGTIEIVKKVVNPPAPGLTFRIQITCRVTHDGAPFDVTLPGGGVVNLAHNGTARFTVPTGTTCTVSEPTRAANDTLTLADDDGSNIAGTVTVGAAGSILHVTLTNTFPSIGGESGAGGGGIPITGTTIIPVLGVGAVLIAAGWTLRRVRRRTG